MAKSRRVCVRQIAHIGITKREHKILYVELHGKKPFEGPSSRREDNVKMDLRKDRL
jgi:hypothetical protein